MFLLSFGVVLHLVLYKKLLFHSGITVAFPEGCRVLFWLQMV